MGGEGDKRIFRADRGAFTVEAAIAFTLTLFSLCLALFVCMAAYGFCAAQTAAGYAASAASLSWFDGDPGPIARGLYTRTKGLSNADKEEAAAMSAESWFEGFSLPGMKEIKARAKYRWTPLVKDVSVEAEAKAVMGERRAAAALGIPGFLERVVSGRSAIPDAPDLIRKLDFVLDAERVAEREIETFSKFTDGVRGIVARVRSFVGKAFLSE